MPLFRLSIYSVHWTCLIGRFVTQLLTDIIFFVACEDNTGSDPLDAKGIKVDRERQKLLREQNILKQVQLLINYGLSFKTNAFPSADHLPLLIYCCEPDWVACIVK